jgi:hypothetical protein
MSRITNTVASLLIVIGSAIFASIALAVPPHLPDLIRDGNRWLITFYDDSSPIHQQWATQGLCFYDAGVVGTHQRYYWVSDTYPDWNGRATQEGDQIFMHGDFQWPFGNRDGGHDGMEWALVTMTPKDIGAGHWKEWVEDGRLGITIGFGNALLQRVGKCGAITHAEALDRYQRLQTSLENPMGIPRDVYEKNP